MEISGFIKYCLNIPYMKCIVLETISKDAFSKRWIDMVFINRPWDEN